MRRRRHILRNSCARPCCCSARACPCGHQPDKTLQKQVRTPFSTLAFESNRLGSDILPSTFVESAVQQLVQTFLPLSDASLELWSEDPEGFVEEEEKGGDSWEIDPRVSASTQNAVRLVNLIQALR